MQSSRVMFWCVVVMAASSMAFSPTPRIVGGEPVAALDYPFLVAILNGNRHEDSTLSQFCGGTLIDDKWVLTAAHCISSTNPSAYKVGVNLHNLSRTESEVNSANDCGRVIEVVFIEMHPNWNSQTYDNDFALMHLAEVAPCLSGQKVVLDDGNYSADVWDGYSSASITDDPPEEALTTVAGWGHRTFQGYDSPDVPYVVEVPLISNADCIDENDSITDNMMCAAYPGGGKDACQGDSGGPFFKQLDDGTFALLGVVSFGVGCADAGNPGVYARVSVWRDYLEEAVSRNVTLCSYSNGGCSPVDEGGICTDVDDDQRECSCATGYIMNDDQMTCSQVCGANQTMIGVSLVADNYPEDISLELTDADSGEVLMSAGAESGSLCVDSGRCLTFTLKDSHGDGMCCENGEGAYTVFEGESANSGTVLASGNFEDGYQVEHERFYCPIVLEEPDYSSASTCGAFKQAYQDNVCCQTQGGYEDKVTAHQVVPSKIYSLPTGDNINRCIPITLSSVDPYFENVDCTEMTDAGLVYLSVEQAGANVSKGYYGDFDTSQPFTGPGGCADSTLTDGTAWVDSVGYTCADYVSSEWCVAYGDGYANDGLTANQACCGCGDHPARVPITTSFFDAGMCPVNVHWSLGTEHYSVGQYDQVRNDDNSPLNVDSDEDSGYFCHHYNETDTKFTEPYDWHFCKNMAVGETYEVKWPHSAAGACNTPDQYQTPFYDGLFCDLSNVDGFFNDLDLVEMVGFQAQVFTVVNDEHYYYPDLIKGMIVEGNFGTEVTYYTGSTTGTSVNNSVCSREGPITWQVDRTCHLISASSFDKMCADMLQQRDDMSADTQPHGSRELPTDDLVANNQQHDVAVQSTSGNPGRRSDGTQEHPTARRGDGYANSGFVYGGK